MYQIEIPVPSHIKKFLDIQYKNDTRISEKSFIGMLILQNLTGKLKFTGNRQEKKYPQTFTITLSSHYFKKGAVIVDPKKISWLVRLFDKLFFSELLRYVNTRLTQKVSAKQLLSQFLQKYEISEDELRLDSIYRRYKRYMDNGIRSFKASNGGIGDNKRAS